MIARPLRRCALVLGSVALACGVTACAGGAEAGGDSPELTASAAASLTEAFERYRSTFGPARVRLSFGGSDELAAQVRQGARPDVFAAANTDLPRALWREGLVERPVTFATNRLVLAVPAGSGIDSLADLERPGVRLVIGSESVPVGRYTREVLARLGPERARRVLAGVRSEEPDVRGVIAKLAAGAAEAGFVYRTDVVAAKGRLRAIELPERLGPETAYAAAVVRRSSQPRLAREFVEELRGGRGASVLRDAGFDAPPVR